MFFDYVNDYNNINEKNIIIRLIKEKELKDISYCERL